MNADNRAIVITLKLDSNGQGNAQSNPTNTQQTSQQTDNNSSAKAIASFAVMQGAELVANEAVAYAEYFWNRELVVNDDYIGQRNKNIAITQINRATNAISTIGSMTAAGAAVGHGIGAAVGAIIGTVTIAAKIFRSNFQGYDQQNIHLRQMDAQLQFTRSRAGWSLKAASIGEDL